MQHHGQPYYQDAPTLSPEWEMVLANEAEQSGIDLSNHELVLLASTALFSGSRSVAAQDDLISNNPKLSAACSALEEDPSFGGHARVVLGKAQSAMRRHLAACTHYEAAIAFLPNDWRIHEALADSLVELGRFRRCLASLQKAEELLRDASSTADSDKKGLESFLMKIKIGQVLYQLSRYDDAIGYLEQAMPTYDQLKDQLSWLQVGQTAQAQFALCAMYAHRKNYNKRRLHWDGAESKLISLPRSIRQEMNWAARESAEKLLINTTADEGFLVLLQGSVFVALILYALYSVRL